MEPITLLIDKPAEFDVAVNGDGALPQAGHIQIITKPGATGKGRSAVCLTFDVELPDGSIRRAQAVTTLLNLATMAGALKAIAQLEGGWDA